VADVAQSALDVGGVRSRFLQSGDASAGEAVVFVHGNPGSSEDWRELAGQVGEFSRAIAIDMPGYGKADRPRDFDYSPEGYAGFLGDALGQLGVERVHLAVHDFGGPFGWAWIDANPSRLASLVIFNTALMTHARWHFWARVWRRPVLGELAMARPPRWLFRRIMRQEPRPLPPAFVDRMYDDYDRGARRGVLRLYRATPLPYPPASRWAARLRELDPPAIVIWGARDQFMSPRRVEEYREALTNLEVVLLEDSGHWPFIDDPERAAAAVVPFLRRQLAA
jgi:pimeloyl-ACP methyl ester carboxylesterase